MLLREIKNIFHKELDELYAKEEVDSFFYLLIEKCFKLERFILAIQPNYVLDKEGESLLFSALAKLHLYTPIQHIIGSAYFMDMELEVNKNVLIPRSETEELVCWILDEVNTEKYLKDSQNLKILDIGTGSGCIAISLAKNLRNAEIYALDVSEKALEIAKRNAKKSNVKVEFLHQSVFDYNIEEKFDIIVSNPPYVRELEKKEMHHNVLGKDPDLALYVSNEKPLVFYKKIIEIATKKLNTGGYLFFEINQYLGEETKQLLIKHRFSRIELRKDIFNNDRMLKGKL